jgi:hypothetical protein
MRRLRELMPIPTEPIGSIPRPADLAAAWADRHAGRISAERFRQIADAALRDTIRRFEDATGGRTLSRSERRRAKTFQKAAKFLTSAARRLVGSFAFKSGRSEPPRIWGGARLVCGGAESKRLPGGALTIVARAREAVPHPFYTRLTV